MRFQHTDLNLLVVLDALLTERNVSRAGIRLNLSQSGVSAALARLREQLGDELLVQVGRTMVPTPRAQQMAQGVRDILRRTQSLLAAEPAFDPAVAHRSFSLVGSDYVAAILVPVLRPRLALAAPSVRLSFRRPIWASNRSIPMNDAVHQALQNNDLVILPDEFALPDYAKAVLFDDSYVCIAWRDNPLVGDSLSLDQFLDLTHVVLEFGDQGPKAIDGTFLEQSGYTRKVAFGIEHFSMLTDAVVGTNSIATVHRRLAVQSARHLPLKIIPPPLDFPKVVSVLQWHRYEDADPALAWFRSLLHDAVADFT